MPPMAAPLPAPLPPPAIAPPAAPTAAPTTAPTAPSFTTSIVLFFEPVSLAAYLLHASIAPWLGAAAALATRAGAAGGGVFCSATVAPPFQFAPTRPVTRAVAITTAMPIAVSFHGLVICPLREAVLPEVAAVAVGVASGRRGVASLNGIACERGAAAAGRDARAASRRGAAAGRDDRRARRPRRLVVARHHLADVLVGDEALGAHLPEHLLPARAALLHRGDLVERERLRTVRAPRGGGARGPPGRWFAGALPRRAWRRGCPG